MPEFTPHRDKNMARITREARSQNQKASQATKALEERVDYLDELADWITDNTQQGLSGWLVGLAAFVGYAQPYPSPPRRP
jgi:hypothetical protein